jgi:hypothetical protein
MGGNESFGCQDNECLKCNIEIEAAEAEYERRYIETKRIEFAKSALLGILAAGVNRYYPAETAQHAVSYADALIAALNERKA